MKIGFASNDWSRTVTDVNGHPIIGGSGYVRVGQYVPLIRNRKIECAIGILAFNEGAGRFGVHSWDGHDHFDCDILIMQRYMHMKALDHLKRARKTGQIIIQDVDDWYWGLHKKNAAWYGSHPDHNPEENINWYREIIEESNGVLASTPFLYEKIVQWNSHTRLHTNYVNVGKFNPPYKHEPKERIIVGWLGSTRHRSGDLGILKPFAHRISSFADFHHTGHVNSPNVPTFYSEIGLPPTAVTTHPFVLPWTMREGLNFDVGIVPLNNIPFNEAKSYIKGLEYAAAGIPFVASKSQQYTQLRDEYGIGVVVDKPKDYVAELKKFLDVDYRVEMAERQREAVKQFDVSIGVKRMLEAIQSIVEKYNRSGSAQLVGV